MKNLTTLCLVMVLSIPAMAEINAVYDNHYGEISISGTSIEEAVAIPEDGQFIQMAPGSYIVMSFPNGYAAVPDGTSAADLRVDTYDIPYPAEAEVFVSSDGLTWTSFGVYEDTANIDLDLKGFHLVRYVKVDQGEHYIDPAYPKLGFDLDAVVALNAEVVCIDIKDGILTYLEGRFLEGLVIPKDYDPFGYNYHTHIFNGSYFNAYANGAGLPPYEGDDAAYLAENPEAESHWAWPYRNVDLIMKWNDAWLANHDCDGDWALDRHWGFDSYVGSGAWETNVMSGSYELIDEETGKTKEIHWNSFVKIIAAPEGAYLGDPMAGEKGDYWYTADGEEIGQVIWGAFAITQDVYTDPGEDVHGRQYISPVYPGLGNLTAEVTAK